MYDCLMPVCLAKLADLALIYRADCEEGDDNQKDAGVGAAALRESRQECIGRKRIGFWKVDAIALHRPGQQVLKE